MALRLPVTCVVLLAGALAAPVRGDEHDPDLDRYLYLATTTPEPFTRHAALDFVRRHAVALDAMLLGRAAGRATDADVAIELLRIIARHDGEFPQHALLESVAHPTPGVSGEAVRLIEAQGARSWVTPLINGVAATSLPETTRVDMLAPFALLLDHKPLDLLAVLLDAKDLGDAVRAGIVDLLTRSRFEGRYAARIRDAAALRTAQASAVLHARFAREDPEALEAVWTAFQAGQRTPEEMAGLVARGVGCASDRWGRLLRDLCTKGGSDALQAACCRRLAGATDPASRQVLQRAAESPSPSVRAAALVALAAFGSPEAIPFWARVLAADTGRPHERAAAASALLRLDDRQGLPFLLEAAGHGDAGVRSLAFIHLSAHPDLTAIPLLIESIADPDRAAAAFARRGFDSAVAALRPYVSPYNDPLVRAALRTPEKLPAALREWWDARQPKK